MMIPEIEKYLAQIASDKSPHTLRGYTGSLIRFCDNMRVTTASQFSELTSAQVQDYLYALKNSGLSASSVNSHARNLTAFFNWLSDNGYENELHIKKFKQEKTLKDVPTIDEVKAMIANTTGKTKLLIVLMAFTGMRREEITNIKIIDISGCFITVHGKGRKERRIALHDDICKLLNDYLAKRDADFEYLFYSRKHFVGGNSEPHKLTAEAIRYTVKTAMVKAGIAPERIEKMSSHSMRRFFAVSLAKNDTSLTKIQLLMGHESAVTTAIYLKSAGAEIAENEIKALPSLM